MRPSPAEIVRTLVAGRLAGLVHVACRPGLHHVRHVTDRDGRVLLLVPVVSDLTAALRATGPDRPLAVALDVLDLPPAAGAPSLGRALVSGWVRQLTGPEERAAALDFAEADPTGDLLDVGTRFRLCRFEVEQAQWDRAGTVRRIDPAAYAEAEPDPLHPVEAVLLADLADRYADRLSAYLCRRLGRTGVDVTPRVERIDRYGMLVSFGHAGARHRTRLAFTRPVAGHDEIPRLFDEMLHPAAGA
ncbi:DUF2470 domain-containing protein [Micromonospora sp. NPDC049900]|uniref:DUF2470 domain-containing protein n=1 Tax=unclassified Micromonospora TaxID=2617518 RepID=UPI0037BD0A12